MSAGNFHPSHPDGPDAFTLPYRFLLPAGLARCPHCQTSAPAECRVLDRDPFGMPTIERIRTLTCPRCGESSKHALLPAEGAS